MDSLKDAPAYQRLNRQGGFLRLKLLTLRAGQAFRGVTEQTLVLRQLCAA